MKLIHTADWQLGKPFARFPQEVRSSLTEARFDAIDRLASVAASTASRHVIVAGDVFDNIDPGDRVVGQAVSRMARASVTWWLMPGNHDHSRAGGLWDRLRRLAPTNVHVVDVPVAVEMEEGSWLLPAPLEHRRTVVDPTAAMVEMATPPGALRIGLAHGSITEFGATGESANLIPPDRARTAGLDYLALGDWHGFLEVGDRTAYSGTPEVDRYGRDEPGACVAVDARPGGTPQFERMQTGRYRWLSRIWDVSVSDDLERELAGLRGEGPLSDALLSLTLTGIASLSARVGMIAALEGRIAHELRHLDLYADGLAAQPTPEEVGGIDVQGALAGASKALQNLANSGGPSSQIATAALERLYVEALRFDAEVAR